MRKKSQEEASSRSAEKQQMILKTAFQLFCQKGREGITMTGIAQTAGISIGTLYNYYPNKTALLLDMYGFYFDTIAVPSFEKLKTIKKPFEMPDFFDYLVTSMVQGHDYASKKTHDEMMALTHLDEDFKRKNGQCMLKWIDQLIPTIDELGYSVPYLREKLHFILTMVETYAHEVAYQETEGLEYGQIKGTILAFMNSFLFR